MTEALPARPSVRRVELHRRVAVIRPERIEVRPSRRALRGPLVGFLIGIAAFAAIALGLRVLPVPVMVVLLLIAVIAIPFAGLGVVYALVGAHVVIDRAKQSATWQQGLLGLGIGTEELVPFWKIAAITVEEAGATPESTGSPTEEFAQWQIVLEKTSGRRLVVGGATAARPLAGAALACAAEVATAIAAVAGAPLCLPPQAEPTPETRSRPRPPRAGAGRDGNRPAATTAAAPRRRRSRRARNH